MIIVIAIIGILASVVLASVVNVRMNARANTVLSQLEHLNKAFFTHRLGQNSPWPVNSLPGTAYHLTNIIASPPPGFENFDKYFSEPPMEPFPGGFYAYSNFAIPYTCSGVDAPRSGVSIRIGESTGSAKQSLQEKLDQTVDGGDGGDCGRIRFNSAQIFYRIAEDSNDF